MDTPTGAIEVRDRRRVSVSMVVVAFVLVLVGGAQVLSGLVDAALSGPDGSVLVVCGLGTAALGASIGVSFRTPARAPLSSIVVAASVAFVAAVSASALPYLATGATDSVVDALFEATAGITTTAASTFFHPEGLSRGLLLWRALSQWLGGLGAITLALVLLPYFGTGEGELSIAPPTTRRTTRFFKRAGNRMRPVSVYYTGFTALIALGYLVTGLGTFDSVAHALTTASTGGLSTRTGSAASFGVASQWVAVVAMFVAGGNVALYVRAARTGVRAGTLRRSTEFRAYVTIVTAAAAWVAWTLPGDLADRIRLGYGTALSVITTTGFEFGTAVGTGPLTLLVVLAGIGAMSGSPSGGFKILRAIALVGFARREVSRQTEQHRVVAVRVGKDVIDEAFLSRLLGYQAVFSIAAFIGAAGLAVEGEGVMDSVTASISAISTLGIVPGGEAFTQLGQLEGIERVSAMVLMAIGRVEVYPLVVVVTATTDRLAIGRRLRLVAAHARRRRA